VSYHFLIAHFIIIILTCMKRVGRPPTGHKPCLSVRMEPAMLQAARTQAKAKGLTVGKWLEGAIQEKIEREGSNGEQ